MMSLIELAEVDVGLGSFAGGDGVTELCFCERVVFFLFCDEGEQTMGLSREVRLHSCGESLCLVETAADERGCFDVELAEVVHGVDVFGINLNGAFEGDADLDGEAESSDGVGMSGLKSVGATEPHLVVAAVGCIGDGQFALVDGVVGHLLGIVDAAEKLVGLGVARLRVENLVEAGGCFIDSTLLEKSVGVGRIGPKSLNTEEEDEEKRKANTGRGRDEHS